MTPQVVNELIVHAENVTIQKKAPPSTETKELIRRNALWLAAAIFLTGLWFSFHLRSYVSRLLVFGLPALWGAWQTAMASAKKDLDEEMDDARKRFLAREKTTENLQFVCLIAACALVLTSSFFIDLGSSSLPSATIEVRDAAGARLLPPLKLSTAEPMKGKVFLPWLWRDQLHLIVTDPPGYVAKDPKPLSFFPGKPVNVTFDEVFEKEELFALCLIPSADLKVPLDNFQDGRIVVRDEKGRVLSAVDVKAFRSICVGMTNPRKLELAFSRANDANFATYLERELVKPRGFLASLQREPILAPSTRNFTKQEHLTVQLTASLTDPYEVSVNLGADEMTRLVLRPIVHKPPPEGDEQ